ncbi:hypothetical protein WJX79_008127 [Trebouxia sp. C0005]
MILVSKQELRAVPSSGQRIVQAPECGDGEVIDSTWSFLCAGSWSCLCGAVLPDRPLDNTVVVGSADQQQVADLAFCPSLTQGHVCWRLRACPLQTEDHQDLCTLFKKTFHSLVDHVKRTTCYGHTDDYKPLPASAVH